MRLHLRLITTLLLHALAMLQLLQAQTWDGGGSDDFWTSGLNWSLEIPPANDGTASVNLAGTLRTTPAVDVPWSVRTVTFSAGAGAFTISGTGLTLANGMTNSATVNQTFGLPLTLGASQPWRAASGNLTFTAGASIDLSSYTLTLNPSATARTISIAGPLSGTGGLTKIGAGVLTLSGANSFSGNITLTAGTTEMAHDSALGTGQLLLNGGTLRAAGAARSIVNQVRVNANSTIAGSLAMTFDGPVTLTGNRTLTVSSTALTTVNGGLLEDVAGRAFTKAGTGALLLTAPNSYSGATTLSGGTLLLGGSGDISPANLVLSGGTLGTSGTWTRSLGTGANQFRWAAGGGFAACGGPLTIDNLTGTPEWGITPHFIPSGSSLILGATLATDRVTWANDFSLGNTTRTIQVLDNTALATDEALFTGAISGSGGLTKSGSGLLRLSGNNAYTGATSVSAGILRAESDPALGTTDAGTTVSSGAVLELQHAIGLTVGAETLSLAGTGVSAGGALRSKAGVNTWGGSVALTAAARINTDIDSLTLDGGVSGAFALTVGGAGNTILNGSLAQTTLTKDGTGTLTLGSANTYTGTTTVSAGRVVARDGLALGSTAAGTTVSSGAALELNHPAGFHVGSESLTISGTGIGNTGALRNVQGANTWAGAVTLGAATTFRVETSSGLTVTSTSSVALGNNRSLTLETHGDLTFAGAIAGTGSSGLVKNGAGSLTLSGSSPNTFAGASTFNEGTVTLAKDPGVSALGAGALTIGNDTGASDTPGAIVELAAHQQINGTGAAAVTINRDGRLDLNGFSDEISSLTLRGPSALPTGGAVDTGAGTLTLGGGVTLTADTVTTQPARIDGNLDLGSATRTFTVNDNATIADDMIVAASVGGAAASGITKAGTGRMVLSGSSSFTGTTTISAGALKLQHGLGLGDIAGATTVSTGAALELDHPTGMTVGAEPLTLSGTGIGNTGALRNLQGANSWGGTVTLAAASTVRIEPATRLILNAPTALNLSTLALTLDAQGDLEIAGAITGTGATALVKNGPGSLTFSGSDASTFTGAATFSEGTVTLTKTAGAAAVGSGAVTIGNDTGVSDTAAATVQLAAHQQINGTGTAAVTINRDGRLDLNGFSDEISSLTLRGPSALPTGGAVDTGAGTLTLGGGVTLTADTVTTQPARIDGNLDLGSATRTFTVNDNATITDDMIAAASVGGAAASGITKAGTGRLVLSGSSSYTGTTTVSAGALKLQHALGLGDIAGATTVSTGAALELDHATGMTVGAEPLTLSGTGIGNTGAFRNGAGDNSWGGTVSLGASASLRVEPGTSLALINANSLSLGNNRTLTVENFGDLEIGGTITGTGSSGLVKSGPEDLTLTGAGANTYTGTTSVQEGQVALSKSAGTAATGPGTLTIGNDTGTGDSALATVQLTASHQINGTGNAAVIINRDGRLDLNGFSDEISTLTLRGPSTLPTGGAVATGNGTLTLGGNVTLTADTITTQPARIEGNLNLGSATRTFTVNDNAAVADDLVVTGTIAQTATAGLTKAGTGRLAVDASSSHTGTTTVNAGILTVQHGSALGGVPSGTTVAAGAALELNHATGITVGAEPLTLNGTGVGGTGALRNIQGDNTWAGTVSLGSAAEIQVDVGSLTLSHPTSLSLGNNRTLTIQNSSDTHILGAITGSGTSGLTMTGPGTLTLWGSGTYPGETFVTQGRVSVRSVLASPLRLESGGTLENLGTVGAVVLGSGGRLTHGTSPGTLSSGAHTWQNGGEFVWQINGANTTPGVGRGTSYDWLDITGALTVTADSSQRFTLSLVGLAADNSRGPIPSFDNTQDYLWTIATASGSIVGFSAESFHLDTSSFADNNPLGGGQFELSVSGNDLNLSFSAVPEPAHAAMLGAFCLSVFAIARRKWELKCRKR